MNSNRIPCINIHNPLANYIVTENVELASNGHERATHHEADRDSDCLPRARRSFRGEGVALATVRTNCQWIKGLSNWSDYQRPDWFGHIIYPQEPLVVDPILSIYNNVALCVG